MRGRSLELRPPRSQAEWDRYHAIRKSCLFDVYHPPGTPQFVAYDRNHPDERDPANHPLVLLLDGEIVGTIRLDIKPDNRAIFRQVAIVDGVRGMTLGTRMLRMAEAWAAKLGAAAVCLNSVREAYRFYERLGFHPTRWDGCTACPTSVPVVKPLIGVAQAA